MTIFGRKIKKGFWSTVLAASIISTTVTVPEASALSNFFKSIGIEVTAEAAVTGMITGDGVFLRSKPASNASVVQVSSVNVTLNSGDRVAVIYVDNGWYYVNASFKGKMVKGYVSGTYVSYSGSVPTGMPTSTPTPTNTPKPTATPRPEQLPAGTTMAVATNGFPLKGFVIATSLRVRSDAGTNYTAIGSLSDRAEVSVQGIAFDDDDRPWYKIYVKLNGKEQFGYVSSEFIAVENRCTPTPTVLPTPGPNDSGIRTYGFPLKGVVNADSLNVRKYAGTSAERVTYILQKTEVQVLELTVDESLAYWYRISFEKGNKMYTGYVSAVYLDVEAPLYTPTPTPKPGKTATPKPTATLIPTATPDPMANTVEYFEIPTTKRGSLWYGGLVDVSSGTLHLRQENKSGATSLGKFEKNQEVIILDMVSDRDVLKPDIWYRVALKKEGIVSYGYMSSLYVKLLNNGDVYAQIAKSSVGLRANASVDSEIKLGFTGTPYYMNSGTEVMLLSEKLVSETVNGTRVENKWFRIKTSDDLEGYVQIDEVKLVGGNVPTGTPTPTPKPPTKTPKPTKTPTVTPTPEGPILPKEYNISEGYPIMMPGKNETGKGVLNKNIVGATIVYEEPTGYSASVTDSGNNTIFVTHDTEFTLYDKYRDNKILYWHVGLTYNGSRYYGYIQTRFIDVTEGDGIERPIPTATPYPDMTKLNNQQFLAYLDAQGFPESYKEPLLELHKKNPAWVFTAYKTGIDWETAVQSENSLGKNLLQTSWNSALLSTEKGAYDWENDEYVVFDSPDWVTVSEAGIRYFMDPRNWFTETYIFQFETLTYDSRYQTKDLVNEMLSITPFYNESFTYVDDTGKKRTISYAQAFVDAAKYAGINPFHLVARVRQEVISRNMNKSRSITGDVEGYEGLYNFYNIGAYHSTEAGGAIVNGLKYARNGSSNNDEYNDACLIPWDNEYKAIVGGAYIIAQSYINRGQDTCYLQKFNVTPQSTFGHQYMANIAAPYSEGTKLAKAYPEPAYMPIEFKIPVYENMPDEPCYEPDDKGNPNNWLKELRFFDENGEEQFMSPTLDGWSDTDYTLTVSKKKEILQINAVPVKEGVKVWGSGVVVLDKGLNTFDVKVTAENGDVRVYTIHITRNK